MPAPTGLDHLRVMQKAATYPNAAVSELFEQYGELFAFGFGDIRFHWLVGAEGLRFILEQPEYFRLRRAYGFLYPIVGDFALITSDEPGHLERRRQVQPAFHAKQVAGWLELSEAKAALFAARPETTFDLYAALKPHVLALICELLLGSDVLARRPGLLADIGKMMAYANLPFLAQQIKLALPFTPWHRFLAARRRVDAVLTEEIAFKRSAEADESVLGLLLAQNPESSTKLLRDSALSLVSAGFDTTSAALTWTVYLLLKHPGTLYDLQTELAGLDARAALKAPLLDAVVKETLRLYPSAPAGLRETAMPLAYKGYHIPANSLLAYSITLTQRQESYFEDALSFKPERWFGGFQPVPFSYAPFGYGARYCIGARLADLIIKTHLHALLKHKLKAAWTMPVEETGNTVHPKGGLPVQLGSKL